MLLGAFDMEGFCSATAPLLSYIGWVIFIIKIAVPVLIIGFGIKDFGTAVISSKEDEIKTSAKKLMWRAVAGVVIFFIPSIIIWLFGTINQYASGKDQFATCQQCLLSPGSCNESGNPEGY